MLLIIGADALIYVNAIPRSGRKDPHMPLSAGPIATLNLPSAVLTASAMLAIFRFKVGRIPVLATCPVIGVFYDLARVGGFPEAPMTPTSRPAGLVNLISARWLGQSSTRSMAWRSMTLLSSCTLLERAFDDREHADPHPNSAGAPDRTGATCGYSA
jgi:hypothetical protein